MMCNLRATVCALVLSCILIVCGCGGGTSGSGLKRYTGTVGDTTNQALSDITVTIESTGETTTTDDNGKFVIHSAAAGEQVPFLLESSDLMARFVLEEIPHDSAHVTVDVIVDAEREIAAVKHLSVRARFVGSCRQYFENGSTILQTVPVPGTPECTLRVKLMGDDHPLINVPVALQYHSCKDPVHWKTIATTMTSNHGELGIAEITFPYRDSEEFCHYRVVAPFGSNLLEPVTYPISTLTEQHHLPGSH